ncbi:AvrE-family type 3 secretion system effector, partial [Pseudomonas sp. 31 R 17]|uniref:AvrE-family type 3 secretion system effector n=1 Tax=Pseudomonas sp. 31 R 17 TaxID=1844101 RepID=UPI00210B52D2
GERSATDTRRHEGRHMQWLREAEAGANFAPVNVLALGRGEAGGPTAIAFALPEVSARVKFDRGQSRAVDLSFKPAQPVTQAQIEDIHKRLSQYSPQFRQDLAVMAPSADLQEQLAMLQRFMAAHPPSATKLDDYHAIGQSLETCMTQHTLMKAGLRQLASVESSVTRVGLQDNGRFAWLDDVAPGNKAAIVQWLGEDPQFARIIQQLQQGEGTSVTLGMELKPQALRTIERRHLAGESTEPLIKRALKDPDNLRVKSMSMNYTATQTHGMSLPALTTLSFFSSASLSHTQKHVNVDFEYGANADKPLRMNLNDTLSPLPRHDLTIDLADQRIRTPNAVA